MLNVSYQQRVYVYGIVILKIFRVRFMPIYFFDWFIVKTWPLLVYTHTFHSYDHSANEIIMFWTFIS